MKWLIRPAIFVFALVSGMGFHWLSTPGGLSNCVVRFPPADVEEAPKLNAPSPLDVSVLYAGLKPGKGDVGPRLRFLIVNGSNEELSYYAHSPVSPIPIIFANGKRLPAQPFCATGIEIYYISPGRSAEVLVDTYYFVGRPGGTDDIRIQFRLSRESPETKPEFISQKFRLPEDFRRAIQSSRD